MTLPTKAGGVVHVDVFTPEAFTELLLAAMSGDKTAAAMARVVARTVGEIGTAPKRSPKLCARPSRALGMAVCTKCATEPDAIVEKARLGLQKIWPSLRKVSVTHPDGGRA